MGLFSKLFSREGEEPTEAEGQDAQAAVPGGEDGVTKSEESAAGGGAKDARDARARGGASEKDAPPPSAAGDKAAQRARDGAAQPAATQKRAGPPPLEPGDKGKKAGDSAKNAPAPAAAKPPAAAGSPGSSPKVPVAAGTAAANREAEAQRAQQGAQGSQGGAAPPPIRRGIGPMRPATETVGRSKSASVASAQATMVMQTHVAEPAVSPLEAAVDAAVNALQEHGGQPANDDGHVGDQRAVAETFSDMAKIHAHPLRELMFQLSVGRAPRQWAAACRPVLRPLFDAATQIGLLELVGALGAFDAALERAAAEPTAYIGEATGEALTAAYERLRQQMPDAFTPPDRADSRRLILLESLLLQIPSLQRRTLSKLYSAGLSSLGQLGSAKAEELSAVAGIDRELAQAVVDHVQRFEVERSRINPTALRSHLPDRLRSIVQKLEQQQIEFERAEQEDSASRKRAARHGREAAVLELDVAFAEVGEVDLIEELKRCPVRGKIERVESYLEQLQSSM